MHRASKNREMILVADDDPSVTASLSLLLRQAGYGVKTASGARETLETVEREPVNLVIQDLNFSRQTTGEEGLRLLGDIRKLRPELPVILLTAWGSIQLAVEGMRIGAADFITKPWTHPRILQSVATALGVATANLPGKPGAPVTRAELDARYDFHDLVGNDPTFLKALDVIGRVSGTDASVLITGESGTGKELIAEAIHRNSRRRDAAFVKVNLGGIPAQLFESEMFGHVKGAFTDARLDRRGRFELAHGGTIFLDEVGDLDPAAQVKLLRVLQDRTYEVLGSSVTRSVDVRVISATNRNLAELVATGRFREDLLYRLNLISVHLPPLRERPGDIPIVAERFLAATAALYGRENVAISPAALKWLQLQPWNGNFRQLKHAIERALLVGRNPALEIEDFQLETATEPTTPDGLPRVGAMTIDEMEKAMILKAMRQYDGNVSKVAEALGISRPALYRRFEKYGIEG
jgi:DNA-binding NtrC family response regulator